MQGSRDIPRVERALFLRALRPGDLPTALRIQSENYPPFLHEDEAAFASRLHIEASYCLAATLDDVVVGYLLAHGWPAQSPPPIGVQLPSTASSEVLFIHDLAIAAGGRGLALGRKLVNQSFALARADGLAIAELIAVQGAGSYWRTLGFSEAITTHSLEAKIAVYGSDARFMTTSIT